MLQTSELCKDCAVSNEINKQNWQSVNHIPGIHDNGPRDHGVWRLTLTAYWSSIVPLVIVSSFPFACDTGDEAATKPGSQTGNYLHRWSGGLL